MQRYSDLWFTSPMSVVTCSNFWVAPGMGRKYSQTLHPNKPRAWICPQDGNWDLPAVATAALPEAMPSQLLTAPAPVSWLCSIGALRMLKRDMPSCRDWPCKSLELFGMTATTMTRVDDAVLSFEALVLQNRESQWIPMPLSRHVCDLRFHVDFVKCIPKSP